MKRVYFFNAANFPYAEIDLSKGNVFFVGDNGSGKTTAIRAIHYYYNSDVKSLGIDVNKKGFKDFYFPYDNSFIVYDFGDYFVLMYKRYGEIKKIFSKQKFDLNKIKDNLELKDVISYAKETFYYIPKTNEEYKKTIYGLNSRYLDFKLTTIKNYQTFINLYNKIFNVNKAVFDTKSIKETIFTTLDRVELGEIEYEEFLRELNNYRHYFLFYKKFKEQEANIEKLFLYKESLLKLQQEIKELLGKIAYKKEVEERLLLEVIDKLKNLEEKKRKVAGQFKYFKEKFECIDRKINSLIFELESKIEEIEELREKFNLKALQKAKRDLLEKDELSKKLIFLKTTLNELISGIKSEVEVIEDEIDALKRELRVLREELREKEIVLKREVAEEFEEESDRIKEEYLQKEYQILEEIDKLKELIKSLEEKKESYLKELKKIKEKYELKREALKEEIKEKIKSLKREIKEIDFKKESLVDEIYNLKKKLNKLKTKLKEDIEKVKEHYEEKIVKNQEKIKDYEAILHTPKNSFKEFLNQNVENWEEELYPVIDEELLRKSIDELKPRIVSEVIFGIELNKSSLKSIPTMKEAQEEIERLRILNESLQEELESKILILEKEYKKKEIEILSLIEVNQEEIKRIEREKEFLKEEIERLNKELKENLAKFDEIEKSEIRLVNVNIKKQEDKIKEILNEIKSLRREIDNLKRELKSEIKSLENSKEKRLKELKERLKKEYAKKEIKIKQKIDELISKKEAISKDERIKELQKEISKIEERLKRIQRSELFLREYEEKEELLENLDKLKTSLREYKEKKRKFEEFYNNLMKKIEEKYRRFEREILEREKELDRIKEGLREVKKLSLPSEKRESNEFLVVLIEDLKRKEAEFKEKRVSLKDVASNIKTALNRFSINGLDVNFNIELLASLDKNELDKIDELYLFKSRKFEVLNRAMAKGIKNLVSGILEKKFDRFERAKEEFLHQIRRINKNLSKVDFGIIRDIRIEIEESKKDILKLFDEIKEEVTILMGLLDNESLFFDKVESERRIKKIEELFDRIKRELKEEKFSLVDVVDINVKFIENEKENSLKLIKNESSTGGSILLKIAIAVSLLELFLKERAPLFLILDEVSVLSTKNQKLLKDFVNEKGLGVIYVTPDLPLVDVEDIDIYKFRNVGGEFEVVRLIGKEGVKI